MYLTWNYEKIIEMIIEKKPLFCSLLEIQNCGLFCDMNIVTKDVK